MVASIRPFDRADVPAVAALIEARLPGWLWGESLLVETLVDHPWADPELPSLVAVDERDRVLGFMGAQVRRMRLDDRQVRGVCCSHLVVAGDRPVGIAGALLVRRMLTGPQDLSWTDSATDAVVRMWGAFGGYLDYARACDWMLVLRPARWAGAVLAARARRGGSGRELVPVGALPLHAAGPLVRASFPAPPRGMSGQEVSTAALVDQLPALTGKARLRVDYDRAHLELLFAQVDATVGPLTHRLVRRDGSPIGWYAYVRRPGGMMRVLHVSGLDEEIDSVVGELVEHARARGANVLTGRAEPHLRGPLERRLAVLAYSRQPVVHTHDPEVRELLATGSSLLTTLDGEWFVT